MTDCPFLTVDIGNSRIKVGLFAEASGKLPEPCDTLAFSPDKETRQFAFAQLGEWLADKISGGAPSFVASVSRPASEQLESFLKTAAAGQYGEFDKFANADMPIENRTEAPERVGIDRLAAAVAANAIRRPETPAVVIDFGTAITVDLVASDGGFEGGAILPGMGLAASALHERTDALPQVVTPLEGKSPPAVGTSTEAAMRAGLFWGTVGAVRELIARQCDGLTQSPQVLVTGSASPDIARLLGSPDYTVRFMPHLVLSGLAIVGRER